MNVKDLVREALKNARENSYSFANMTARDIAEDIVTFDAALEEANLDDVTKAVEEISQEQKGFVADTPEAITAFQLIAVKHALKLEQKGLQMTRGRKLRKPWALQLGLKASSSYEEVIAKIEEKLKELEQNPKAKFKTF